MAKKIPSPILRKVLFQATYKPELKFYTLMHQAAMNFPEYKEWETNSLSVLLHDFGKRCSLGIRHDNFYYNWDFGGTPSYIDDIHQAVEVLPSALQLPQMKRIGLRKQFLIATAMSFQEVNSILNVKFLSQNEQLLAIFPTEFRDMSYVAVGKDNDFIVRLSLGPMRKEEIPNHIQIDQKHHFAADRPEEYASVMQSYPDVAVFIDLDIFRDDEDIKLADAVEFVDKAEALMENKVTKLRDYIFAGQRSL